MPTIEQIRAARALLDWSQSDLADHAGLSQTGIARIENGTNQPNTSTLEKIRAAFLSAGIEFLGTRGVQQRTNEVKVLHGHQGFIEFLNDVYAVVTLGEKNKEIVVNNVSEDLFLFWEKDFAHVHQARMEAAGAKYRIIVEEGDKNFTASKYAQYRFIPSEFFQSISYYIYGDRSALIDFSKQEVTVYIIQSSAIADFYREEFNRVWERAKATKAA
jgi:transcriptional regulator with XRE-family HTH domain